MNIKDIKIGDKVKRVIKDHGDMNIGDTGVIFALSGNFVRIRVDNRNNQNDSYEYDPVYLELINDDNNIINDKTMNLKESFVRAFLQEPEKSFRKAGITNGDGLLTTDGQNIFLSWMLKERGNDFKKEVVDELLAEEEKESKK